MMKNFAFVIILFSLFFNTLTQAAAQSSHNSPSSLNFFDTSGLPQWARDLRRFDIVAFGVFPFSMFLTNFFYDLYRWNNANGMDFSAAGRRYAPWPFKSAGAIDKTGSEYRRTILLAAGVSLTVALADFFIVRNRRNREQYIPEDLPSSGSIDIERRPLGTAESGRDPPGISAGIQNDQSQEDILQNGVFQTDEVSQPEAVPE